MRAFGMSQVLCDHEWKSSHQNVEEHKVKERRETVATLIIDLH